MGHKYIKDSQLYKDCFFPPKKKVKSLNKIFDIKKKVCKCAKNKKSTCGGVRKK